jgi:hypothetical protein
MDKRLLPGTISDKNERASSASRLLDSHAAIPGNVTNPAVYPACESCHWTVLETRLFQGRHICVACIAGYFDAETDEA